MPDELLTAPAARRPSPRPRSSPNPPAEPVDALAGDASWRSRLRRRAGFRQVATISAMLVGTQAVTSVLGLLYWAVAARQCSVAAVGVAGAAVSLMLLLGSVGMLGLGTLSMAEIPRLASDRRRLFVRTSLLTAGAASTLFGAVAALGARLLGQHDLSVLGHPLNVLDFAVGTGLTGLTMVLDQAVLVVGLSRVQLERNTVASIAKIVFLILLTLAGHDAGMDIFLSWTLGNIVSLGSVYVRTRTRERGTVRRLVDLSLVRRMARAAASHHALNLMLQAPILLLSVVVAVVLSAADNGYFSTARSVAGFVFVLPFSVTIALFAAARGSERELVQRMRFTIPFGVAMSLLADIVLFPFGHSVLAVFGHAYSVNALTTLRVLALAGLAFVIKDHFVALRRVQGRTGNAALVALGGAVIELVAAYAGAKVGGTVGLCVFWVLALAVEAAVLAVPLWRAMRDPARKGPRDTDPQQMPMTASDAMAGTKT